MNHRTKGRKFGRTKDQRKAFIKSLMGNLVKNGRIRTTEARAKEIRRHIEKLITKSRIDNLTNRRILNQKLQKSEAKKMMDEIGPKYKERNGGYIRIIKLNPRPKDGSPMAIIEFV